MTPSFLLPCQVKEAFLQKSSLSGFFTLHQYIFMSVKGWWVSRLTANTRSSLDPNSRGRLIKSIMLIT
jgi:hypothetical protein